VEGDPEAADARAEEPEAYQADVCFTFELVQLGSVWNHVGEQRLNQRWIDRVIKHRQMASLSG